MSPWRYERDKDDGIYCVHARVIGPKVTVQTSGNLDDDEPDMRLISAAPDLLMALENLLPLAGWSNYDDAELRREHELGNGAAAPILAARAAITKAKG